MIIQGKATDNGGGTIGETVGDKPRLIFNMLFESKGSASIESKNNSMSAVGVLRDKAALFQWVRDPPG